MADTAEGVVAAAAAAPAAPSEPVNPIENLEGGTRFQHAIAAWRNLDLTALTSALDSTASDIVTYQRDSTVQRKDLAQKTKEFRKMDDATKLGEIKGLLKAYQGFIDLLTNHSKAVNASFLQAYSSLSDVPDPYPLLEASVDSMLVSEGTMPKLEEENARLQQNVASLTTQLEETEGRLNTERTSRKEIEDNLESKVKEVAASWTGVLEEKENNWTAKEKTLEEKVENQDRLLNELRASYEVNQRLGKSGSGEEGHQGASSAELEMLHSDLERASSRLAEVEARNEKLRLDLAQAKSSVSTSHETSLEDDPSYMRMRSENSSLIRKLEAARMEKDSSKRDLETRMRSMERETAILKEEKVALKAKLSKWSDYDNVKEELEVLKSIEFATGDGDEEGPSDGKGDNLEKMLLQRNKKLGDDLTILRVAHQELQKRLKEVQEDLTSTAASLTKSNQLNEKLEADLENMQSEGANAFPSGASVAGTYVSRADGRRGGPGASGRISPTSSIISGLDPRGGGGAAGRDVYGGGSGMLPMITAQKDRYKKKNVELEKELSDSHRTVSQLRMEVAALQRDNLNLYEKTRYVSTYNRGGATAASSSSYTTNPNPSTVQIGGASSPGGGDMDRYRKAYESNISPFAAFRGRESARAYRRMSLPERVVYSVTRMVLATRTSRNLFAAYCLALHVLVFLSLYWMGSTDVEKHASNLGQSVAAAAGAGAQAARDGAADHGDWKQHGFDGT